MSCFIVNNKTASSIVTALIEMHHIHSSEAQTFLTSMMNVNTLSVNTRYSKNESAPNHIFKKQNTGFDEKDEGQNYRAIMQMINNIRCFKCQSCEFEGYEETLVFKVLQKLEDELLNEAKSLCVQAGFYSWDSIENKTHYDLPLNEECSWGLDD